MDNKNLENFQCQDCGSAPTDGHSCSGCGKTFVYSSSQESMAATRDLKCILDQKGFRERTGPHGVHYTHPMHGMLFIYPGTFRIALGETSQPLRKYLESLK